MKFSELLRIRLQARTILAIINAEKALDEYMEEINSPHTKVKVMRAKAGIETQCNLSREDYRSLAWCFAKAKEWRGTMTGCGDPSLLADFDEAIKDSNQALCKILLALKRAGL